MPFCFNVIAMAIPGDHNLKLSHDKLDKLRESIYAWATREYKRDEGGKFSETEGRGGGKGKDKKAKKKERKVERQRERRGDAAKSKATQKSLLAGIRSDITGEEKEAYGKKDKPLGEGGAPSFEETRGAEIEKGLKEGAGEKPVGAKPEGGPAKPDIESAKPKTELQPDNLNDFPKEDLDKMRAVGWRDDEIRNMKPENVKASIATAKLAHAAEDLAAAKKAESGKLKDLPPSKDPFEIMAGVPEMSPAEAGAFGEQSLTPKERARADKIKAREEKTKEKENVRQAKIAIKLKMFAEKTVAKIKADAKAADAKAVAGFHESEARREADEESEANLVNEAINQDEAAKVGEAEAIKGEEDAKFGKIASDAEQAKASDEKEARKVNKAIDKDEANKAKEAEKIKGEDEAEARATNKAIDKDEAAKKAEEAGIKSEEDKKFKKVAKDAEKAKATDEKEARATDKAINKDEAAKKSESDKEKKAAEKAKAADEREARLTDKAINKDTENKKKEEDKAKAADELEARKTNKAIDKDDENKKKAADKEIAADEKEARLTNKAIDKDEENKKKAAEKEKAADEKEARLVDKAINRDEANKIKEEKREAKRSEREKKKAEREKKKAEKNSMLSKLAKAFVKMKGKGAGGKGLGKAVGKGVGGKAKGKMPTPLTVKEKARSRKDDNKLRRAIRHITAREPNKLLELIQKEVGESMAASASAPVVNYSTMLMDQPYQMVDVAHIPTVYEHESHKDGTVSVKMVPIFAENIRRFGEVEVRYDRTWLQGAVDADFRHRASGYKAPMHFGHHANPAVGVVRERAGHIELCEVKLCLHEGKPTYVVFANKVFKDEEAFEKAKKDFPYRSVEISPDRPNEINSLALLSSEAPYFRFPNLAFSADTGGSRVFVWSDNSMATENKDAVVGGVTAGPVTSAAAVEPAKGDPTTFAAPPPAAPLPPPAAPPVQAAAAPVAPVAPAAPAMPPVNPMAGVESKLDQLLSQFSALMEALAPDVEPDEEEVAEDESVGEESESPVVQASAVPAPAAAAPATFAAPVADVTPQTPVATVTNADEVGKLQGELAGLKAKLEAFERAKTHDSLYSTLATELEGYALGPTWRTDLKSKVEKDGEAAARAYVAGVKTSAPKLPPTSVADATPVSQESPEVAKYAARGPEVLAKARHFSDIYDHIQKTKGFRAFSGQARDKFIEAQFLMEGN